MFTCTTPSKKDFELQFRSLPLPEELAKKVSRMLHVDITLDKMEETKSEVVSDRAFGHVPMQEIEITYYGKCGRYVKGRYVIGNIRFFLRKQKWMGWYEPL